MNFENAYILQDESVNLIIEQLKTLVFIFHSQNYEKKIPKHLRVQKMELVCESYCVSSYSDNSINSARGSL